MDGVVDKSGTFKSADNKTYPEGSYFVEDGVVRVCQCLERPCIRKCCNATQVFITNKPICIDLNGTKSSFMPLDRHLYAKDNGTNLTFYSDFSLSRFNVLYGDVCVYDKYQLNHSIPEEVTYLLQNGSVYIADDSVRGVDGYCFENFVNDEETYVFMCFDRPTKDATFYFYPVGMIISEPFLLITFLVYAFLPGLRNLHGKCIMCYVCVLFVGYLFLIIVQLATDYTSLLVCHSLAFVIQFSFLASFFWLNIMCFDIWWVFSGLRPLRGSIKEREFKKFVIYSIYAWGCPLVIFLITLIMQTVESIPDSFIKPEFGAEKCWFKSDYATFLYFYLPIIILVVLNIIMFISTAFKLKAHTKDTEVLKNGESRRHDDNERQRFNLYLKLFIVMGVNWVMELISWALGGPKYIWYVTDITNTLQGVLIFLIFVWKRRILRLLNAKLCPSLKLVTTSSSSTRSKVSPSRTTSSSLKQTSSNNISTSPDTIILKKVTTSDESDVPA